MTRPDALLERTVADEWVRVGLRGNWQFKAARSCPLCGRLPGAAVWYSLASGEELCGSCWEPDEGAA